MYNQTEIVVFENGSSYNTTSQYGEEEVRRLRSLGEGNKILGRTEQAAQRDSQTFSHKFGGVIRLQSEVGEQAFTQVGKKLVRNVYQRAL